jgi:hypothetical protein
MNFMMDGKFATHRVANAFLVRRCGFRHPYNLLLMLHLFC